MILTILFTSVEVILRKHCHNKCVCLLCTSTNLPVTNYLSGFFIPCHCISYDSFIIMINEKANVSAYLDTFDI